MSDSLYSSRLQLIMRGIEWVILFTTLLQIWLSRHVQTQPPSLLWLGVYLGLLWLLSLHLPLQRPLPQRRAYVAVGLGLVLSAMAVGLWFELYLYFLLLKSCFLLPRREVVLGALGCGVVYIFTVAQIMPERVAEVVAQIQAGQVESIYNLQVVLVSEIISYLGISCFAICFGLIVVAEGRSRQRAEALARQVEAQAITLERTRIARDIHDGLGHSLTTLSVQLELAQRLAALEPVAATTALATAQELAGQCLQEVRRSVHTIRRRHFDLNAALQELVGQLQPVQPLAVHCRLELPELPDAVGHQLYCIFQEGLTNVYKHAQATEIHISGHATARDICLELRDDGVGFDPDQVAAGYGLCGMRERAQLIGGQVRVCSRPGQTSIQVRVPR